MKTMDNYDDYMVFWRKVIDDDEEDSYPQSWHEQGMALKSDRKNPRMFPQIRRENGEEELQSFTITLPRSVVIELGNYGVKSGRGGGNMSIFLEIAALVTLGLFTNPELAKEQLQRLVRVDMATPTTVKQLAQNVVDAGIRLNKMID
jgi:hypothetical protein